MASIWNEQTAAEQGIKRWLKHWRNFVNEATKMEIERNSVLERHAQTVVVMITAALLLWVGNTTQKTQVAVAEMRVEIRLLKESSEQPNVAYEQLKSRVDYLQEKVMRLEAAQDNP